MSNTIEQHQEENVALAHALRAKKEHLDIIAAQLELRKEQLEIFKQELKEAQQGKRKISKLPVSSPHKKKELAEINCIIEKVHKDIDALQNISIPMLSTALVRGREDYNAQLASEAHCAKHTSYEASVHSPR